jgi:hypothetical protein
MMRNLWIQTESPFATWVADFSAASGSPEALRAIVDHVLQSGTKHRVFDVLEAPDIGLKAGESLPDALARLGGQGIVDLFAFTTFATVRARLARYGTDGRIIEEDTTDLGAILRDLEPVPGSIPKGFTRRFPPVCITGQRWPPSAVPRAPLEVSVSLHSDIWFPFVFGSAHPWADLRRMFDNRVLADRNTHRLNGFLREFRHAVVDVGGTWRVDQDGTGADAARWLDASGILLDATPPVLMPPESSSAVWF